MTAVADRLAQLAERFDLDESAVRALGALLELLESDPLAPTTVTQPEQAIDAHVADSLVALELPEVRHAWRIADLGSGAGFPGLVLAACLPAVRVWLVESVRRKCEFLRRAAAGAGIGGAEVVCARAEEWTEGRGACDVVTARALASLPVVAEYAAPLLHEGGVLVVWRGRRDAPEEARAERAAAELGLAVDEIRPVHPWPGARDRHLHVLRKVAPTPARFPRRAGVAAKRPLG